MLWRLSVSLGDVEGQIEESVGVAPFVIVPGNQLNEVGVEGDTGLGIEDGASAVTNKVLGDDFFISVSEDTLKIQINIQNIHNKILPSIHLRRLP